MRAQIAPWLYRAKWSTRRCLSFAQFGTSGGTSTAAVGRVNSRAVSCHCPGGSGGPVQRQLGSDVAGQHNSSLTRVQPVFGAAIERDPTGSTWLHRLLDAAGARPLLRSLVDQPGDLIPDTAAPSSSKKADLACFEVGVPPDRRLLSWCVEHPERLRVPPAVASTDSDRNRRKLICDDPPGSRAAAQEEARVFVENGDVNDNVWKRFERETEVDCVLATDRLVLCIEGKRDERLARHSTWLRHRNQVARNLEAASRIADARRRFAVLVCVENEGDPVGDPAFVRHEMSAASPHLFAAERQMLAERPAVASHARRQYGGQCCLSREAAVPADLGRRPLRPALPA